MLRHLAQPGHPMSDGGVSSQAGQDKHRRTPYGLRRQLASTASVRRTFSFYVEVSMPTSFIASSTLGLTSLSGAEPR